MKLYEAKGITAYMSKENWIVRQSDNDDVLHFFKNVNIYF